jgi:hypothetical protein
MNSFEEVKDELPNAEVTKEDVSKQIAKPGDVEGAELSAEINDWKSKSIICWNEY